MSIYDFTVLVLGQPAAKGSPQVVTKGRGGNSLPFPRVVTDSAKSKRWQTTVARAAQVAMRGRAPLDGPLCCDLFIARRRPKSHVGTTGKPRKGWTIAPDTKPDADKLARSTLDGLSGIAIHDDARIVRLVVHKVWCERGEPEGALIRAWSAPPDAAEFWSREYRGALDPETP